MNLATFLRAYISAPRQVGAIMPSSRRLTQTMTEWVDWSRVRSVVEFGAGTGAVTSAILDAVHADCRVLLVERNARFIKVLRQRFPGADIVHGTVAEARAFCHNADLGEVDIVVSSLPWAAFSPFVQRQCLGAAMSILRPQGMFVTFTQIQSLLLSSGRRIGGVLPRIFEQVERTPIVWRAAPPAVVYRCHRPIRRANRHRQG